MNILIDRILELSGPVPDPAKYKRYLQCLDGRELSQRAADLEAERGRPRTEGRWTALRIKMATTRQDRALAGLGESKRMEVCCG